MKNFTLLIFVLSLVTVHFISKAQLALQTEEIIIDGITAEDFDVAGKNIITNTSGRSVTVVWEREIIELAENWQTAVCDVNQCYLPHVNTQQFDLGSESEGNLDVHVYPNETDGYAIVKITLTDIASEDNSVSTTFYFNRTSSSSTYERITNAVKMFPNPASNMVIIEDHPKAHSVIIYSLDGRLIHQQQLAGMTEVNINQFQSGNYIVNIFDQNGVKSSTNLLTKQ